MAQSVTAEDVVYSIEPLRRQHRRVPPLVPAFSVIQEVKAVDERTVTITIGPAGSGVHQLSSPAPSSPRASDDQADLIPWVPARLCYVSRSPQENFVIQRFDDYWGTPAYLDKVTYKIYEERRLRW